MAGEHRDVKLLLAQFEANCSLVSKHRNPDKRVENFQRIGVLNCADSALEWKV